MSDILIGTTRNFAVGLEACLNEVNYEKVTINDFTYFTLNDPDWYEDEVSDTGNNIMYYLCNIVGQDNYGLVRIGPEFYDTELSGAIENFNIVFSRSVDIENE